MTRALPILICVIAAGCKGTITGPESEPTIGIGPSTGRPGADVEVSLKWTSLGAKVSALQLDLHLPAGVAYGDVQAAAATNAAQKTCLAAPRSDGARVLVAGLNRT